jgi:endonuclease/exonuclease/phosphatase family metal-dependent hydrolase
VQITAALAQGEQVSERSAGMVKRRQRVDDRDLGARGQLGDRLVGARADYDRVEVAGEHPAGVAGGLAARKLHFVAAQDDWCRAKLGDADLEGDPRPRRGLLEDEGDAAPGEVATAAPLPAPCFELESKVEQLGQLKGAELFTGEEVALQAPDTTSVQLTVLSWNLFHGRDFPPDPDLFTWRSRLLRITERNTTHLQLNRDLLAEFSQLLATAEWDVALLQECPPRFAKPLAQACRADAHRVLTSRNTFGALRALAARLNPDLIASGEGGSNLTLVRAGLSGVRYAPIRGITNTGTTGGIVERRELAIHNGPLERRVMAFTRVGGEAGAELCIANLHASAHRPELTTADVLRAAVAADEWAGEAPLIFGGDLNLRPAESPAIFEQLRDRFGLTAPTAPRAIDHLLVRGLEVLDRPTQWPPERRELRKGDRALRLSDHTPVEARFALSNAR